MFFLDGLTDCRDRWVHSQRAFRERKEKHVKELQDKISSLGDLTSNLRTDNESLKRELTRFATENEILRATSKSQPHQENGQDFRNENFPNHNYMHEPAVTGPMEYAPRDFNSLFPHKGGINPPHIITFDEQSGEKLLSAGSTWDLIQSHELFKRGLVNLEDVSNRLKGHERCNGQGPAFKESAVLNVIQESVAAGGSDELI